MDGPGPDELDTTLHGVTELRVHGVSGTPPDEMLGHPAPLVRRVAGDQAAGFWRRWYPGGTTHDRPGVRHLEAYSWGGLTSGPATRALWVLLLPFTLVNLAHWMLPPYEFRGRRVGGLTVTLLRLVGLSYTLTLMLATALVTMDIGAWQCGAMPECAQRLGPLSFAGQWGTGPRLAVGALLPALLVVVLWRLGRVVLRPADGLRPPHPAVAAGTVPLAGQGFWVGDPSTVRLRAVHVTAWASGLGAVTLAPALRYADGSAAESVAGVLLFADLALLVAAVVAACSNAATGRGGLAADGLTRPLALVRWLAVALLAAGLVAVATLPARYPPPPSHLPGLRPAVLGLFVLQLVLLASLFGGVAVQRPWRMGAGRAGFAVAMRGFAAPATALLGWLVGGAFSAGLGLWVAELVGTPVTSTGTASGMLEDAAQTVQDTTLPLAQRVTALTSDRPIVVPPAYFWAGTAAVFALGLTLVVAVVVAFKVRRAARLGTAEVLAEHPTEDPRSVGVRAAAVARERAVAALTDRVDVLLAWVVGVPTAVVVVGMGTYVYGGPDYVQDEWPSVVTPAGVVTIAFAASGLVALAFWAFRDRSLRRYVGILWDVATYWPRANHPLTPPCYGERAVPDLVGRVAALTAADGDRMVLSGHSQGSILVASAVLQLDDATAARTALLTYGCPLRRLYARFFPAYLGAAALETASVRVGGRWVNLWAPSDPVGGWAMTAAATPPDERLADPVSLRRGPDGALPPVCGHSGFLLRPEYATAVAALAAYEPTDGYARETRRTDP